MKEGGAPFNQTYSVPTEKTCVVELVTDFVSYSGNATFGFWQQMGATLEYYVMNGRSWN